MNILTNPHTWAQSTLHIAFYYWPIQFNHINSAIHSVGHGTAVSLPFMNVCLGRNRCCVLLAHSWSLSGCLEIANVCQGLILLKVFSWHKKNRGYFLLKPSKFKNSDFCERLYMTCNLCYCSLRSVCRYLTYLPLDKMAAVSQTMFSDAFSWMKSFACLVSCLHHLRCTTGRVHPGITQQDTSNLCPYWVQTIKYVNFVERSRCQISYMSSQLNC